MANARKLIIVIRVLQKYVVLNYMSRKSLWTNEIKDISNRIITLEIF